MAAMPELSPRSFSRFNAVKRLLKDWRGLQLGVACNGDTGAANLMHAHAGFDTDPCRIWRWRGPNVAGILCRELIQ